MTITPIRSGSNGFSKTTRPDWVMYPKYYKDTENAKKVFNVVRKHERRRKNTRSPLERVSVRLDRLESRYRDDLSEAFQLELFSPHIEDMDNSNNCSIVLKIEGIGPGGFAYLVTGDTENPDGTGLSSCSTMRWELTCWQPRITDRRTPRTRGWLWR